MQAIVSYLSKIASSLASGHATEHTYRPELRDLFAQLTEFHVINEPKWSEHGKPDFIFLKWEWKDAFPIAYGEAKDMHIWLEKIEKSEQLARYFGYAKLILTNGIEFRFYKNGIRYGEPIVLATKKDTTLTILDENFGRFSDSLWDFLASPVDTIRRASHLAEIMWGKARRIRDNLREMMENTERYPDIWKLYHTFKSEILHDLSYEDFADLYAQTLVYGLFVARYHDQTPDTFSRSEARDLVPKSNPLLRRFFDHIAGEGYEKRLEYIVDELCEVFAHADVHALMHGMYQRETHDPVIHFYEDFLKEYDTELRMQRWVFYTPAPVVKFIIRAVDDVLRTHFWLAKWLADTSKIKIEREIQKYDKKWERKTETIETHRVQILDPATGTGTFLDEIVRHIHSKMSGQAGMWQSYVNADLLPRLHGFELMMASYTIAHLKLGLTLAETGVTDIEKRLQIYLTNSLEEAKTTKEDQGTLFGLLESITDEARQADEVKRDKPVMIVVGNPPYSVSSTNKSPWIEELMKDYKKNLNERNIQPLSDDYIKFIRFWESLIEKNGEWILAYISNNSFIDGIIHRQMRQHLRETFDSIYILDLHGSTKKKETTPDGGKDENVFDIQQWVSINIFIKTKNPTKKWVFHYDLYGKRQEKYDFLENTKIEEIAWNDLSEETHGFFTLKNQDGIEGYEKGFKIDAIFSVTTSGIKTHHDAELVYFQEEGRDNEKNYLYKPFDFRRIEYDLKKVERHRYSIMKNFLQKNYWLALMRSQVDGKDFSTVLITQSLLDINFYWFQTYLFPLYIYSDSENLEWTTKTPNLDATIWAKISESVGRETTSEEVLDYIYAVLHSPSYREKYREFLKIDFPRVPYPRDRASFEALVRLGGELRTLHLLESPKVEEYITTFPVAGSGEVEKVAFRHPELDSGSTDSLYEDAEINSTWQVWINETQYFGDVPEVAWNFYIGWYQPAQKWLKDRKWRTLTWEDISHYQSMIAALSETARVMGEVDKVLEI